jgi:hypothetical protein
MVSMNSFIIRAGWGEFFETGIPHRMKEKKI